MSIPPEATVLLLAQWHAGDGAALGRLIDLHMPWLAEHVQRRLGQFLRAHAEPMDYLQDTILAFLRDAPRFQVRDGTHFRALLARIAENSLRDRHDWFRRKRRDLARNAEMPTDSVLCLDSALRNSSTPSRNAARNETRDWVRLALELLAGDDRRILVARDYENRSFEDIGADFGLTPNAARMRWTRAVARLADAMKELRAGRVPTAAADGT